MKWLIILCLLLLLIPGSIAYIKPEYYNGVLVKFYSDKINKTQCYDMFDTIAPEYYEGVRAIMIYDTIYAHAGTYGYYDHIVKVFVSCDRTILVHELAHHQQYLHNVSLTDALNHKHFEEYYYEISKTKNFYIEMKEMLNAMLTQMNSTYVTTRVRK